MLICLKSSNLLIFFNHTQWHSRKHNNTMVLKIDNKIHNDSQ